MDYFEYLNLRINKNSGDLYILYNELYDYLYNLCCRIYDSKNIFLVNELNVLHLIDILYSHCPREDRRMRIRINELRRKFVSLLSNEFDDDFPEESDK